jgi:hypothetical protein
MKVVYSYDVARDARPVNLKAPKRLDPVADKCPQRGHQAKFSQDNTGAAWCAANRLKIVLLSGGQSHWLSSI